jgi:signal transduction histidine kinase
MGYFARMSLARYLLIGGFAVLLGGMLVMGTWLTSAIENRVVRHEGELFALYVDSVVSDHIDSLARGTPLSDADRKALDDAFSKTKLGEHVVEFKIWSPDGRVLYGNDPTVVGLKFAVKPQLAAAFAGQTQSALSDLGDEEHKFEHQHWPRLFETYAPIFDRKTGAIAGVAEIYRKPDIVTRAVGSARIESWIVVIVATLITYLLLAALIRRASNTIAGQERELRQKVAQLTALLEQNEQLHQRVARAAARTTALNERFLHRVAADLHDGPGQVLALASMRIRTLADTCGDCGATASECRGMAEELCTLHSALQDALHDLRAVAAGLRLPAMEDFSLAETAQRAIHDYERAAGVPAALTVDGVPYDAPLPVKITLFRLLQESLANGFRHGGGVGQRVALSSSDGQLLIEVADGGKGFDPGAAGEAGHLGLAGMRERVEILGGTFAVQSARQQGTVIRVAIPLTLSAEDHE